MLAILVCQVSMAQGETYWTCYPNPPKLDPVTWEDQPIMVWVNSSVPIRGTSKNIKPQRTNFNYMGLTHTTPICASEDNNNRMPCFKCILQPIQWFFTIRLYGPNLRPTKNLHSTNRFGDYGRLQMPCLTQTVQLLAMTQEELYIQSPPVQAPEVILVGDLQSNKVQSIYNISCQNCHLTNSIQKTKDAVS